MVDMEEEEVAVEEVGTEEGSKWNNSIDLQ